MSYTVWTCGDNEDEYIILSGLDFRSQAERLAINLGRIYSDDNVWIEED